MEFKIRDSIGIRNYKCNRLYKNWAGYDSLVGPNIFYGGPKNPSIFAFEVLVIIFYFFGYTINIDVHF